MIIINTTIKSKKYSINIVVFLLILALLVVFFAVKSESLASVQVFKDIDFASENAKIDGYIWDAVENVDEPKQFNLSDEDVSTVLNTLKNAEFKAIKHEEISLTDVNYYVNITLNKRYEIMLDTNNQILIFREDVDSRNGELYFNLTNNNNFFKVIDELAKETIN